MEHTVTDGEQKLSEYAKKLYHASALENWGAIVAAKLAPVFADPAEIDARKRQLEYDLDQNGVWKYGEKFTPEHFQKAQTLEKAGKLSHGAADIIKYLKPEKLAEIINTIAESRPGKLGGEKPISA